MKNFESRGLDKELILVEQLRLLLGNVGSSVIPAYLLAVLMTLGLANETNTAAFYVWCGAVIASKTVCALHAKYFLRSRLSGENASEVYLEVLVLNIMDAVVWASLALISLSSATTVEFMLVNSVLAGIAGSSMSLLSPVLSVFITFIGIEFLIVSIEFWRLGDSSYYILTLALVLYFASLSMQARNSSLAVLSAIKLRFENSELLIRLRDETAKAIAAHQEAVQANLSKSKFLASASHDLRQPIHALGLFLAVLGNGQLSEEQKQVLANAKSVNESSSEMLNTLLDFSRIEAGVVDVQIAPFSLQTLLNKIEKEFAPQADAKGLLYRTRESSVVLNSDVSLIELIVRNLVSNAIRYTDEGGVLVACRQRGDMASLEIWDTGIGIPRSQHQEIFREFHQLGNAERDRRKGLGLGLAIADGLTRSLGLHLTLASTPGRGSVFRLIVPMSERSITEKNKTSVHIDLRNQDIEVLVLDDDEAVRLGMCQLLREFGCHCHSVETLEQAVAYAASNFVDIFISDYRLRGQESGVDAIYEVRAIMNRHLPALLITGDTAPERLRDAHASGVQLLHKPVDPDVLYQAIAGELMRANRIA